MQRQRQAETQPAAARAWWLTRDVWIDFLGIPRDVQIVLLVVKKTEAVVQEQVAVDLLS